jgi:hypothetical protein
MSSGGTAHSSVTRLYSDAIESDGFDVCSSYALLDGRCSVSALKDMHGAPTSREHVPPQRNMGSPTGREAHGDGILAVPNWIAVMACHRRTVMCAVGSLTTDRVTQYVGEQGKGNR